MRPGRSLLFVMLASVLGCGVSAPGAAPASAATPSASQRAPVDPAPRALEPASSASPQRERPALDAEQKAIESVLRDACRLGYDVSDPQKPRVGCADCSVDEPFDVDAWETTAALGWRPYVVLTGSFSARGVDERFLALEGHCNPKHQGYAFFGRRDGRWANLRASYAHDQDQCRPLRRADGVDLVICSRSREYSGGTALDSLEALGLTGSPGIDVMLPHWMAGSGKPRGPYVFDFRIEGFVVEDVDGDGQEDVEVHIRERSIPAALWKDDPEGPPFVSAPAGKLHRVVLLGKGTKLVPDAASTAVLRRAASLLPKP